MLFKTKKNKKFNYLVEGDGQPIVLLQGLMGGLSNFTKLISYFSSRGYRVYFPDLPIYDFRREKRAAEREHIELEGGVCIVEGIHALNPELTRLLPENGVFRVYAGLREEYSLDGLRSIDTRDIRLCRRMLRDASDRGHSPEKTLAMWDKVLDGENKYIKVYKNSANLVLDTSFSYELGVIAGLVGGELARMDAGSAHYERLARTARRFAGVQPLSVRCMPRDSMLAEFYGKIGV